ncbi:hypothetical protein GPECTOR_256g648 [Gonium pectorale]|uniref:Ankyrin repeat domain-containing protein n=1 Tax=Gonium pectorale TaxID=33097 RepID=A0A150FW79_GONPE|nr:hypothetical protein GPECTOR_256g648 [Gonium pectorale]|eukprot:KXZ41873.1 hypothetical protein GPECTOR_256g648 [Gonium pectorale]
MRVDAAAHALRGGRSDLADMLLAPLPEELPDGIAANITRLLAAAAEGCDLATLQRRVAMGRLEADAKAEALAAAAGSPMTDWAAKVEWLEAQGATPTALAAERAAALPSDADALARLAWLQGRSYPIATGAVLAALRVGSAAALRVYGAHGAQCAARGGHLHVLAWLLETLGAEEVWLSAGLFTAAAESGSVALLAWLRQRGCEWGPGALAGAAGSGCEAALDWLVEQGCPSPRRPSPPPRAHGDLATVGALRRLGVRWGTFGDECWAALPETAPLPALRWLLEAGCPVEPDVLRSFVAKCDQRGTQEAVEVMALLDSGERTQVGLAEEEEEEREERGEGEQE